MSLRTQFDRLRNRVADFIRPSYTLEDPMLDNTSADRQVSPHRYEALRAYYLQRGLYDTIRRISSEALENVDRPGLKEVEEWRNPATAIVETYVTKLAGDDLLEIVDTGETEAEPGESTKADSGDGASEVDSPLLDAIKNTWEASNWTYQNRPTARMFATDGDLFLAADVSTTSGLVEWLDPRYVVSKETNRRGILTFLRLDIPQMGWNGDPEKPYYHTEIWNKEAGTRKTYRHTEPRGTKESRLGDTVVFEDLSETATGSGRAFTGYDFIPVVYRQFKDVKLSSGQGAFEDATDAIDRVNRRSTKLDEMLFPKVVWALTRPSGPEGEALAPIRLEDEDMEAVAPSPLDYDEKEIGYIVVEGKKLFRLPGGAELKPMVPPVDLSPMLAALDRDIEDLTSRKPELAYQSFRRSGSGGSAGRSRGSGNDAGGGSYPSGVALQFMLEDVRHLILEARGNYESALIRAFQMALTLGKVAGIESYQGLGEYKDGDLDFTFGEPNREVFPPSEIEEIGKARARAEAIAAFSKIGMLRVGLESLGYSPAGIEKIMANREEPAPRGIDDLLDGLDG